jgi:thiamine pyrophosphate-dependent acetolactate synthase large subunit-like protein
MNSVEIPAIPSVRRERQETGAEALVRALEANGVDVVFTIPGVHTLDLYAALERSQIRTVLPRHEQGAGYMADGYARASGRVGVAITVTGPGLTNIVTPIAEAFADSSRVLVISTCLDRPYLGHLDGRLHEMTDQLAVVRPIVKWAHRVMSAAEIRSAVAEAFRQLYDGRPRPVYLEVPLDVLRERTAMSDPLVIAVPPAKPNDHLLDRAAQLLADANRVFVLAGGGAVSERSSQLLSQLASAIGAVVSTTVTGKGAIPDDHPLAIGAFGYRWMPDNPVSELMRGSDVTIAIGTGLGARTTAEGTMPLPSPLIHIDIDPLEFHRRYPAAVALRADCAEALAGLLERIEAGFRPRSRWEPWEIESVRLRLLSVTDDSARRYQPWLIALRRALPRDAFTAHDMTMVCYEAVRAFPVYVPRTYAFPRGFGTLGSALPMAIGAKYARPDRPAVAICGDGGIQFTVQELGTLAQYRLPVIVVVFDDRSHTAVKRAMQQAGIRPRDVDLVNPDFVELAQSYKLNAIRVSDPAELERAASQAVVDTSPWLIHVMLGTEA